MEILVLLGVTAVGGTIGTVIGGLILDYIRTKRNGKRQEHLTYCPRQSD